MANSKREPEQGPQSITNNEQEPDLDSQKTTRKKRGPAPGSQRAKHGGQAVRKKYGPEFYSRIGKMGGRKVKEKRGPGFYSEIGKMALRAAATTRAYPIPRGGSSLEQKLFLIETASMRQGLLSMGCRNSRMEATPPSSPSQCRHRMLWTASMKHTVQKVL